MRYCVYDKSKYNNYMYKYIREVKYKSICIRITGTLILRNVWKYGLDLLIYFSQKTLHLCKILCS